MAFIKPALFGVILPAAVGGGLFALVGYWSLGLTDREDLAPWEVLPISLSLGYIVGNIGIEGWPALSPHDRMEWLVFIMSFSLVTPRIWESGGRRMRLAAQVVLSLTIPCLILGELFRETWDTSEGFAWLGGLSVAVFIFWRSIDFSFSLLPRGSSVPVVYIGICGASTLILALSGSTRLAQHSGVFVAIFVAIWFISLLLPRWETENPAAMRLSFLSVAAAPLSLCLAAFWLNGCFYEGVPPLGFILLALAPFCAGIGRLEALQRLSERTIGLIQIAFIAVPVIIAVYISV